jgi:hypothetical protein
MEGFMLVICKCNTILCKGFEYLFPWVSVVLDISEKKSMLEINEIGVDTPRYFGES